jgi:hypothetical protein
VFQTANRVREVSDVVAVVISLVAAPPRVNAQPPKVYPVLVVAAVLASDPVETLRESEEIRVELSVAGTEVARVFPSKMMVGVAADVARAGAPNPKTPEMAREMIPAIADGFLVSDCVRMITPLLEPFLSLTQEQLRP